MEEDYFENFVGIYDKHFSRQYRFWRHHVQQLIDRHLHCGEIHNGFACMTGKYCCHRYLQAFTRKHCCFELVIFNPFSFAFLFVCRCSQRFRRFCVFENQ